jgi:hypothetical protein
MVRVIRKCLQTELFWVASPASGLLGTQWVPSDADAPADCTPKRDLQTRAVWEAAEGIRTLDLLHGKQYIRASSAREMSCKRRTSDGLDGGLAFRELCGDTGG